jgi:hypothetical protein
MQGPTHHTIRPLQHGPPVPITIDHEDFSAIEYEIFIPAGIWSHQAVQDFLAEPLAEGGATISKGATGLWRGGQEETHVIRIVIRAVKDQRDHFFDNLQARVGSLMATLAEWPEAAQHEVMFTAKPMKVGVSRLKPPAV